MLVAKTTAPVRNTLHDQCSIKKRCERRPQNESQGRAIWTRASGALQAENATAVKSMKPLEGVFIEAGTRRAVGYLYNEARHCKLVLTVADAPISDEVQTFTAIRYEAKCSSPAALQASI
jgi:hypothetical protein